MLHLYRLLCGPQYNELEPQPSRGVLDLGNLPNRVFEILVDKLSDDERVRNDLI